MKAWGTAPTWCRLGTARRRLSTPTVRPPAISRPRQRQWHIEAVFETHVHADFVTGALELTAVCGSRLFASAEAGPAYGQLGLRGGGRVTLNGMEVEAIASPGHSPEHVSAKEAQLLSEPSANGWFDRGRAS